MVTCQRIVFCSSDAELLLLMTATPLRGRGGRLPPHERRGATPLPDHEPMALVVGHQPPQCLRVGPADRARGHENRLAAGVGKLEETAHQFTAYSLATPRGGDQHQIQPERLGAFGKTQHRRGAVTEVQHKITREIEGGQQERGAAGENRPGRAGRIAPATAP
ncbi:MAG: hypothetical protein BWK76_05095 [Desulfobulbaceae bacterium A2]|nr:MAG: hypothetical protein BWK76_05095 [Desulfobulbaceae bacterium A2]